MGNNAIALQEWERWFIDMLEQDKRSEFWSVSHRRIEGILYVDFWWLSPESQAFVAVVPSLTRKNYEAIKREVLAQYEVFKADVRKRMLDENTDPKEAEDVIEGYYRLLGIASPIADTQALTLYAKDDDTFGISFLRLPQTVQ